MKATHLWLSLLFAAHETLLATAEAKPGYPRDDSSQLTLSNTRPWLTDGDDESDCHACEFPAATALAFDPLEALQDGLEVMQCTWFALWVGTWPSAIDWTAAVIDTHLVSSLSTLSRALARPGDVERYRDVENDLNRYFSQNVAYYFGEDAFSLRNEAYDDMLWVVLGWLESMKTIRSHSERHYCPVGASDLERTGEKTTTKPWQGAQFIEAFSHRARIFYDISARGWDESLCGGGMVWSPYLAPYKNAITNELFIAASIGMYLYFPGDNNTAPFILDNLSEADDEPTSPYNPAHLQAAVNGYAWLKDSGMRNHRGLYIDGFHVSDWRHGGTTCDIRNEMVFTYNQGVLLSGLRGLWEATGTASYLTDAHALVRAVILATGWSLAAQKSTQTAWSGIGRAGILEEQCDAAGTCSQDAQTFKGIFFHHLTLLCEPLPLEPVAPGRTFAASEALAHLHLQSCREYAPWVAHNARAAMGTRDREGRFGMWWGAGLDQDDEKDFVAPPVEEGAVDYRNEFSRLRGERWLREGEESKLPHSFGRRQQVLREEEGLVGAEKDPNVRGRGRTVETQSGGIAVLGALWELLHLEER